MRTIPTLGDHCKTTCQLRRIHNGTQHEFHEEHEAVEHVLRGERKPRVPRL